MFISRIDRIGFFYGNIYFLGIMFVAIIGYALFNAFFPAIDGPVRSLVNIVLFLFGAVWIVFAIPVSYSLAVRRFHDMGLTGWLSVLYLVPFVSTIVVLIQLFTPSKNQDNPYGDPQKPRDVMGILFATQKNTPPVQPPTPPARIFNPPTPPTPPPGSYGAGPM